MAKPHARSGQVVSVAPLGAALATARTAALIKAAQLEIVRLVLPAGQLLREHQVPGEITVQCLEGEVEFVLPGATHRLVAATGCTWRRARRMRCGRSAMPRCW